MVAERVFAATEMLAAARRVQPVFSGAQVVATRELVGLSQADVAARVEISVSALSQAERGRTRLSIASIAVVAAALGVAPDAFVARDEPSVGLCPQLRRLRTVPARDQRRALRYVQASVRVVRVLREVVVFPDLFAFEHPVDPAAGAVLSSASVERAAQQTRAVLGVAADDPLDMSLVGLVEAAGVTVVRCLCLDFETGAYSAVVDDVAVVVLPAVAAACDVFDLAHELGHLVMHRRGGAPAGQRRAEAQADRFAAVLLAAAPDSAAADGTDRAAGRPQLLSRAVALSGMTSSDIASSAGLPAATVDSIVAAPLLSLA